MYIYSTIHCNIILGHNTAIHVKAQQMNDPELMNKHPYKDILKPSLAKMGETGPVQLLVT